MLEYNICYSLDSKYVEQLAVSVCSILKNANPDDKINFYILDGGLTQEEKSSIEDLKKIKDFSIEYISIDQEEFKNCPLNVIKKGDKYEPTHVTLPTYFRIKLPSLLKRLDKILYLDCDVIVRTSLEELYKQNIQDKAVLMVFDAENEKECQRLDLKRYFNAGVMFINLDYWRKNKIEDKLFNFINRNNKEILWFDQDVTNVVLQDKIGEISNKWNYQYFQYKDVNLDEFAQCSIIHMAGRFKPWLMSFEHPIYDLYYYYLSFTNWRKNITLYQNMSMGRHLKNGIGGRVTNILVNAYDEDVQKVYSELDNNYKYINVSTELLDSKIDDSKNEFYSELKKNYDFVKNLNEESSYLSTITTDEKISKVYEEITKNYEYTNKLVDEVKSVCEGCKTELNNFASEIELIQENFDEKIIYESTQTDEKISKVYDEVSKNYNYTEELVKNAENVAFENSKKHTDEKYNELHSSISSEISKVYEEVSKNYNYTEELVNNAKNVAFENSKKHTDEKYNELHSSVSNEISKVYDEVSKNYNYTEELVKNAENVAFENSKKYSDGKYSELYSYANEEISKTYNEAKNSYKSFENIVDAKAQENAQKIANVNLVVNELMNSKLDKTEVFAIDEKISQIEVQNQVKIDELQKWFENELNNQRIKYENKIMNLEKIISSFENKYEPKKRSLFQRIKNKIKKVTNK